MAMASRAGSASNRGTTPVPRAKVTSEPKESTPQATSADLKKISEDVLRAGFVKKVYGLLASQLVLTVIIASVCMYVPLVQRAFLAVASAQTWWLRLAFAVPPIASLVLLKFCKDRYPTNYILLFVFTLAIALQLGFICSVFNSLGHGHLILQAAAITAVIFLGLTVYTVYSGKNFSYMGGFLSTLLWGLSIVGFAAVFFPQLRESLAIGFVGATTFCGYILYDTWRLTKQLGYDDYIGATIELYLDIVNLFLYILDILVKMSADSEKKKKRND